MDKLLLPPRPDHAERHPYRSAALARLDSLHGMFKEGEGENGLSDYSCESLMANLDNKTCGSSGACWRNQAGQDQI